MSQGHIAPDRSLQLPPLQTGTPNGATPTPKAPVRQSIDEAIMSMPFEAKLAILRKIAPPKTLDKHVPRGPLIAIEGDNAEAVAGLARWLSETLRKDNELSVSLLDTPDVASKGIKDEAMAEYHMLVAQWLGKSKRIMRDLEYEVSTQLENTKSISMDISTTPPPRPAASGREVDENYDDEDTPTKSSTNNNTTTQVDSANPTAAPSPKKTSITDVMEVDNAADSKPTTKPIAILPLFSLHASNTYACRIPLTDTYAPNDHWSWNATQWRGVVGPDLTIYLKDGEEKGKMVEQIDEERLVVVRKAVDAEIDGSTLRRVGFEVGEWVRAFGEAL